MLDCASCGKLVIVASTKKCLSENSCNFNAVKIFAIKNQLKKYIEPAAWTAAMLALYFMDGTKAGFSFCLFKLVGFDACFGCGIGHAIHHALHFNLQESINEHALGIPATMAILYTVIKFFLPLKTKTQRHEPTTNVYDAARPATR